MNILTNEQRRGKFSVPDDGPQGGSMTRKRFIKLLMARGVSRNKAVDLAQEANSLHSYSQLFTELQWWLVSKSISTLTGAFSVLAISAAKADAALSAICAMADLC